MKNIFNKPLKICNNKKITGYNRNGYCSVNINDTGKHFVCVKVTKKFLDFTFSQNNDLITPNIQNNFPGLRPGDLWCICIHRWIEAYNFNPNIAPFIIGESTSAEILKYVSQEIIENYLID